MEIREDRWLAQVMGHPVFSLADLPGSAAIAQLAARVRAHAGGRGRAMYDAKFGTERVDLVRELARAGFYVVDVNVTLARRAPGAVPPEGPAGIVVREATPELHAAALDIAGTCFRYSRFHLDPLIPRAVADQVKREWIRGYVERRRGERLWVALRDGRPLGFLAVLAGEGGGERVRTIDLIGVAPAAQGEGIGTALVSSFISRYQDESDRLTVGTQVANLPSLVLYERLGFRVAQTRFVMHLHVSGDG